MANSDNQAPLQAQAEFRNLAQTCIDDFESANQESTFPNVDQANSTIDISEVLALLKELHEKNKELKKNSLELDKENVSPNQLLQGRNAKK